MFGIPHFYWSLVGDLWFPGGPAAYENMTSTGWRLAYLWVVNACCVFGVLVPLALRESRDGQTRRWIPHAMAWIAAVLLSVRGGVGLIFDSGIIAYGWDTTFLVGGILFSCVALSAQRAPPSVPAP